MMFFIKILRVRGLKQIGEELLRKTSISAPVRHIIVQMTFLVFVMHLCACFFYSGGLFNLNDQANTWLTSDGLDQYDANGNRIATVSIFFKYISSLYFAVVTCATVGYGDIVPKNRFELFWVLLVMLFGVSLFSYVLGDMASQFGEITRSNKATEETNRQISELDTQFNLGIELTQKLELYFQ